MASKIFLQVCVASSLLLLLPAPSQPAPSPQFSLFPPRWRRIGLFSESNPLTRMRLGLEGLRSNVGRSMKNLLNTGSVLGQRMLGMAAGLVNRGPPPLSYGYATARPPVAPPAYETVVYDGGDQHQTPDCNCNFGADDEVNQFEPVETNHLESYGAPAAPVQDNYGSPLAPAEESYGSPIAPPDEEFRGPGEPSLTELLVNDVAPPLDPIPLHTLDNGSPPQTLQHLIATPLAPLTIDLGSPAIHLPTPPRPTIVQPAPTIDLATPTISLPDTTIVEPVPTTSNIDHALVLGAASVVQGASASVPDQEHPEKYFSDDVNHVNQKLEHTLYYLDLESFRGHSEESKKVRNHLKPAFLY